MTKTNLLIVEDEAAIRDMLSFAIPTDEFELAEAEDANSAMQQLAQKTPDLILLDWMLPGKSGIEFIKWLKQQQAYKDIPVIMLTAKAEEANKIKGLMTGADDYVTKPFSPAELIARIKVVLRRGPLASPEDEIKIKELVLNMAKHSISINGQALRLSPIEYKMLSFFMRHPNKTYSRDQLLTRVWSGESFNDDRTVDVQIRRVRDKLKQHNYQDLIKTIRGAGYQLVANDK
jgi:two-component system phosphate regulon response regulator PhoB